MDTKSYKVKVAGVELDYTFPALDCSWCNNPSLSAYVDYDAGKILVCYEDFPDEWDSIETHLGSAFFFHNNRICASEYKSESWYGDIDSWDDVWDSERGRYKESFLEYIPAGAWRIVDAYSHSGTCFFESGCGTQCRWDTSRGIGVWAAHPDLVRNIKELLPLFRYLKITKSSAGVYCGEFFKDDVSIFQQYGMCKWDIVERCKKAVPELNKEYGKFDMIYKTDEDAFRARTQEEFDADCEFLSDFNTVTDINVAVFDLSGNVIDEGEVEETLPVEPSGDYTSAYLAHIVMERWKRSKNVAMLEAWSDIRTLSLFIADTPMTYEEV